MSNKSRKRLWPVSLVLAVAIVGVAAAFLMVASSTSSTQAHDGVAGSTHCDDLDQFGQLLHDALNDHNCAEGQTAPPPTIDPTPASGPGVPVSYVIEGPEFVIQERQSVTRYTINVLDEDGEPANFDLRDDSENVTVFLDVVNTAQGDIDRTDECLPAASNAIARNNMGDELNPCEFKLDVSEPDPWFEIVSTTIPHGTDVGITLQVGGAPVGDTHTVTFLTPAQATDLEILCLAIKFQRNATTGRIEVEVSPSTTGDLTDNISNHRILVRQHQGTTLLSSTDGSPMEGNASIRVFGSSDLEDGLLKATFTGAQAGTGYTVFVQTDNLDAQGNRTTQTAQGSVIVRQASR